MLVALSIPETAMKALPFGQGTSISSAVRFVASTEGTPLFFVDGSRHEVNADAGRRLARGVDSDSLVAAYWRHRQPAARS
jgi:hypothetical protein